ncbi:MAG: hypothetical protein VXV87_03575, partial [Pseudomonadota bacterium]|nr:hypothetical protein [Pseudomonadota bacterium]
MFRDTLRKNGQSGVTEKEMQELLNTFPAEERAAREAAEAAEAAAPEEEALRLSFDLARWGEAMQGPEERAAREAAAAAEAQQARRAAVLQVAQLAET